MITIEPVQVADISAVKELLALTWNNTYCAFLSQATIDRAMSLWNNEHNLSAQSQNPDIYFAVAKNETKQVAGIVTMRKIDSNTIVLDRLYVHPKFQGQGIGKKLFDSALTHFSDVQLIRVEVEQQNKDSIRFYEKQGFIKVGEGVEKIGDEEIPIIKMEKKL